MWEIDVLRNVIQEREEWNDGDDSGESLLIFRRKLFFTDDIIDGDGELGLWSAILLQ